MYLEIMRSKIHRATITQADLHYVGSITIDKNLLEKSGIKPHEKVSVLDINNGARFETYVIEGEPGSGEICVNGAAARMVHKGDLIIIIAYGWMTPEEADKHQPVVVHVDDNNKATSVVEG
jgi:aspartate 1-decarboxylase